MTNTLKYAGAAVAGVVVGLLLSAFTGGMSLGGVYNQVQKNFGDGLNVGTTNQFQVSNKGVIIANGVDTLTVQYTFNATSSFPGQIPNPFGTAGLAPDPNGKATTTVLAIMAQITSGIKGSITYDISTSSSAYGSSTPAFIYAHTVATNALDSLFWQPNRVASSSLALPNSIFTADNSKDGRSPFVLGPTDWLTLRIATTSPGTFVGGYWQGTLSVTVQKP